MTKGRYIAIRAFKDSLPILMGYGSMGFAAGVLIAARSAAQTPAVWSGLLAVTSFSGTLQFAITDPMRENASLWAIALLVLAISFRYALYGFTLLARLSGITLWKKMFLIWCLTDENFALESAAKFARQEDFVRYSLTLCLFTLTYWTCGCTLGALAGEKLPIPDKGMEFAMVALFIAIFTDQAKALYLGWRKERAS